jgi:membrane associated rhomboid family serine protease
MPARNPRAVEARVILVPIGHGEGTVRRLPWVTFGIMAICLVVHLALVAGLPSVEDVPEVTPADAWAHWESHPYLRIDPRLLEAVGAPSDPARRESLVASIREERGAEPPDDLAVLVTEQAELDRLTEEALGAPPAAAADDTFLRHGLVPAQPSASSWITHQFLHGGWMHLLGNLFLLFLAAPALEDRWGRLVFAGFYLAAGIAGGAAHAALTRHPDLPLIGASGAIAGAMGAFLVRLARTQIKFFYLFFFGFRGRMGTFEAPAWAMLPLWFGGQVLTGALGMEQGVAVWAHAGGFAFGALFALGMRQLQIEERHLAPRLERGLTRHGNAAVARANEARERGELAQAWSILETERRARPHDSDVVQALFDVALDRGDVAPATPAVLALVKRLAASGDVAGAAARWRDLVDHAPAARADGRALLAIAQQLREAGDATGAALALRHASESPALGAALAGRITEAAREIAPDAAAAAARRALAAPDAADLPDARRAQLASLAAAAPASRSADPPWLRAAPAAAAEPRAAAPAPTPRAVPRPASEPPPLDLALPDPPAAFDATAACEAVDARAVDFDPAGDVAPPDDLPALELADAPYVDTAADPGAGVALDLERASEAAPEDGRLPGDGPTSDGAQLDGLDLGASFAAALPRFSKLEAMEAVVRELRESELALTLVGRDRAVTLAFGKIEAVSLVEIAGPRAPSLVLDLALSWHALAEGGALRVVRLRGEPGATRVDAPLRLLAEELARRSGAACLTPAPQGGETPRFEDLAAYAREVLLVEG